MFSHVQRYPISCGIAAITSLATGSVNVFHVIGGYAADLSGWFGAIIGAVTIMGMIKTWATNKALRELIANQRSEVTGQRSALTAPLTSSSDI